MGLTVLGKKKKTNLYVLSSLTKGSIASRKRGQQKRQGKKKTLRTLSSISPERP